MWDPPCTTDLPSKSNRLTLHYGFPSHQPNLGLGTHNTFLSQQKLGFRTMHYFPGKTRLTMHYFPSKNQGLGFPSTNCCVGLIMHSCPSKNSRLGNEYWAQIFLKLFRHFRGIPAKSRDIPPKKFDFPGFEGHAELFGPHPFTRKTPTPPEDIRTKKFGFGFLFLAWGIGFGTHCARAL